MSPPLAGIRVIEVGTWAFVPSAGVALAEWGAEVTKIEHPGTADPMRGLSVSGGVLPAVPDVNFMWDLHNRGKRSVGIDLHIEQGRSVLYRLVEDADVFITSLRPAGREKLGIEAHQIHAVNPRIIYGRGSGAGPRGPGTELGGFDIASFWARSGALYKATHEDAQVPASMPAAGFGDVLSGVILAGAIAAALAGRSDGDPDPCIVDVSLLATGMWAMRSEIAGCLLADTSRFYQPVDRRFVPNPISAPYRTKDGRFIQLAMLDADRHWPEFCRAIAREDLIDHPSYGTMEFRRKNNQACVEILDGVFAQRTLDEWRDAFAHVDGVWAIAQDPREVANDPQAIANGYVQRVTDLGGGEYTFVPGPAQFNETSASLSPAPEWGENTEEVLLEYGYSWDDLIALKDVGAIL